MSEHESRESHECIISFLRKCLSMNGFFKAVWYISLNPFVSKLPSGSYKYPSLTSSGVPCLSLENNVLMHQCAISAKDINPKAAFPDLLLSSAFAEQRPLVPVGEENNLLNNTLWDLFFSNELKLLVLPSPLGREGERLL